MTILVAYDPETRDQAPVRFATAAARFAVAPLVVASVRARPTSRADTQWRESARVLADLARHAGIQEVRPRVLGGSTAGDVARQLQRAVDEEHADVVVVGSTRRGAVARVAPGTTAQQMINGCRRPVVVVPHGYDPPARLKTIGVAFAPAPEGRRAVRVAAAIARIAGARLRVLTVLRPMLGAYASAGPTREAAERRRAELETTVATAVAELGDGIGVESDVFVDDPGDALLGVSPHLDLLVMGSRGYGAMLGVLLGSVSRRVTAEAECPVLVVPRASRPVPAVRSARDAVGVRPLSAWRPNDVRMKTVGGFAGPLLPNARVGRFAGGPRRRSEGAGGFAGDPDGQPQGSFGDVDIGLIARQGGSATVARDDADATLGDSAHAA